LPRRLWEADNPGELRFERSDRRGCLGCLPILGRDDVADDGIVADDLA
jgi:hypothetical protein